MSKILIVEDEKQIARYIQLELEHENFEVAIAHDGEKGLHLALSNDYDLILLDVMLPIKDGWEILETLRKTKETPVLFLTAKDSLEDKMEGFGLGADDYLTKPFAIEELLARIRAILRRNADSNETEPSILSLGKLQVNPDYRQVMWDQEELELTKKEFDLLYFLLVNKNQVLTREQILDQVWGYEYYGDTNVVDVYIRYLRTKVDEHVGEKLIHTVRGVGYQIKDKKE